MLTKVLGIFSLIASLQSYDEDGRVYWDIDSECANSRTFKYLFVGQRDMVLTWNGAYTPFCSLALKTTSKKALCIALTNASYEVDKVQIGVSFNGYWAPKDVHYMKRKGKVFCNGNSNVAWIILRASMDTNGSFTLLIYDHIFEDIFGKQTVDNDVLLRILAAVVISTVLISTILIFVFCCKCLGKEDDNESTWNTNSEVIYHTSSSSNFDNMNFQCEVNETVAEIYETKLQNMNN